MPTLDFAVARSKHLDWRNKLKSFLEGRRTLSETEAISHKDCELGRWLYSQGLQKYGSAPSMKELEQSHAELHATIRRIIDMKKAGEVKGAEREFGKVKPISDKVMTLLTKVEQEVEG
ncbi:MAG TPA: CZB domain-containing protein [Terriglobales bacterium]|nr:CZB domain-containing protein [Terriglobales bacterium]